MAIEHHIDSPFAEAVRIIGSQSETARVIGMSQASVYKRLKSGKPVWDTAIRALEAASGIPRFKLRPDLFEAPAITSVPSDADVASSIIPGDPHVPCDQAAASHPRDAA